jgi:serine/threonine-protein kinase RsbW
MTINRVDISDNSALYTLQLPSRLDSLTTVENFADSLKEQYNIGDDTYANMLTCLSEATINAIVHGNKEDESKTVYINLEVQDAKRLIFTIADEGEGFDYNNLPDPTSPENLENLTGRGVFIFNLKGNEVELHFKI